jgi:hypothetical protein
MTRAQRIWSRQEFLDLLDDEDIDALWQRWGLPSTEARSKEAASFIAAIATLSETTLVHELLLLRTQTLRMLRDILTFLEAQNVSVRTTGSHLVLREEFDITPQQVAAALRWSQAAVRRASTDTWDDLRNRFSREIIPLLAKIDAYGAVETTRRYEHPYESMMRSMTGGPSEIRNLVTVRFNEEGLRTRDEYVQKLAELNNSLSPLRDRNVPPAARELLQNLVNSHRRQIAELGNDKANIREADRINPGFSRFNELTEEDHETWKRFAESILFLSDVEESGESIDVLRMDLFRKRPQLYEVWIVVTILRFMQRSGYTVNILTLQTNESGRIVWNLNYAKSRTAIARFAHKGDGTTSFLFYQLFRKGKRDNMPDLALMPTNSADDTPMWILDPKHSERGAYSLSIYREVAARYQKDFAPQATWIVEYYPRHELGIANPFLLVTHAELLTDVSPGTKGCKLLLERLRSFHGARETTLAIIDISGSFVGNLSRVNADLKELFEQGIVFADEIIWFSNKAIHATGGLDGIEHGTLQPPPNLDGAGGTRFGPVLEILEQSRSVEWTFNRLRIYTDGNFDDLTLDHARASLERLADLEIISLIPSCA